MKDDGPPGKVLRSLVDDIIGVIRSEDVETICPAGSEGFSDSEVVSLESDLLELPVPHGHYLPDEAYQRPKSSL